MADEKDTLEGGDTYAVQALREAVTLEREVEDARVRADDLRRAVEVLMDGLPLSVEPPGGQVPFEWLGPDQAEVIGAARDRWRESFAGLSTERRERLEQAQDAFFGWRVMHDRFREVEERFQEALEEAAPLDKGRWHSQLEEFAELTTACEVAGLSRGPDGLFALEPGAGIDQAGVFDQWYVRRLEMAVYLSISGTEVRQMAAIADADLGDGSASVVKVQVANFADELREAAGELAAASSGIPDDARDAARIAALGSYRALTPQGLSGREREPRAAVVASANATAGIER